MPTEQSHYNPNSNVIPTTKESKKNLLPTDKSEPNVNVTEVSNKDIENTADPKESEHIDGVNKSNNTE
jgi:hypothetical protein